MCLCWPLRGDDPYEHNNQTSSNIIKLPNKGPWDDHTHLETPWNTPESYALFLAKTTHQRIHCIAFYSIPMYFVCVTSVVVLSFLAFGSGRDEPVLQSYWISFWKTPYMSCWNPVVAWLLYCLIHSDDSTASSRAWSFCVGQKRLKSHTFSSKVDHVPMPGRLW